MAEEDAVCPQMHLPVQSGSNAVLKRIEAVEGLGGAIAALEANQHQTGFIKDSLFGVERHIGALRRRADDP